MADKSTDPRLIQQVLQAPETALPKVNLIYIHDDQLSIVRQRKGRGFVYKHDNKIIREKKELDRFKKLVIPPAWEQVRITPVINGHLQATGRDEKQRKQYRYHPEWMRIRNQTKFYKMADFGSRLPAIRKQIEKDLHQKGWPKTKVLALVVKLMEETHIRIGSRQYARRNKTYGLATLRTKHVHLYRDKLKFEFTGKKGKKHKVTLRNRKLQRLVSRCEEIPGWQLFQYFDESGDKHGIDSGLVNEYLHRISGTSFTAKDFRTWAASVIFFDTLMEYGLSEDEGDIKKNIIQATDTAAQALGNTRSVCRTYYIHPLLAAAYSDGSIAKAFNKADRIEKEKAYFTPSEEAVLSLIKNYRPEINRET